MSSYLWPKTTSSAEKGDTNEESTSADTIETVDTTPVAEPVVDPLPENTQSTQTETHEDDNECGECCEQDTDNESESESESEDISGPDDESESESESDEEEEAEDPSQGSFKITADKSTYVISVNGRPFYYNSSLQDSYKVMWRLTYKMSRHLSMDHHIRIEPVGQNKLQIYSTYKFFVISYERLLHTISCNKAKFAEPTTE